MKNLPERRLVLTGTRRQKDTILRASHEVVIDWSIAVLLLIVVSIAIFEYSGIYTTGINAQHTQELLAMPKEMYDSTSQGLELIARGVIICRE